MELDISMTCSKLSDFAALSFCIMPSMTTCVNSFQSSWLTWYAFPLQCRWGKRIPPGNGILRMAGTLPYSAQPIHSKSTPGGNGTWSTRSNKR